MKKIKINFKNKTATQAVIEALRNYIIENEIKPGVSLPTEKELASMMDVSRTIIREALQHFKVLGIIDSRRKAGIKISQLLPDNPYENYFPYMHLDKDSESHLLEMRIIVELGMIDLLIEKASSEDIEKLAAIAEKMVEMKTPEETSKQDAIFHTYLFEIINNNFMNTLKGLVIDYFNSKNSINPSKTLSKQNRDTHMEIVKALKARNCNKFRDAVKNHYKVY